LPRNSAQVVSHIQGRGNAKEGLETKVMEAMKAKEQSQDSRRQTELDDRYGKIGISAVAAAVRHKGEERKNVERRFVPYDRD
jgi:predicted transcriptional regulator